MKFPVASSLSLGLSALQLASARYVMYVDQYHLKDLPPQDVAAGIDHVIMAFSNSSLLVSPPGNYTPFMDPDALRARFDTGAKLMIAIGGWGDNAGFDAALETDESRKDFAQNVKNLLDRYKFDGVDIDLEYPAGNGADYRQKPNSDKVSQIDSYPLLLAAIREAIGHDKLLSIAVPALRRDQIAFTPEKTPSIWEQVDFVNVMTYDLMNRRDNVTKHHTDLKGSLESMKHYLYDLALPAAKANLGFAFYAKYFTIDSTQPCATGLGCATVLLEDAQGQDTGKSGTVTFEKANYARPATNLTLSPDGSCGATAGHMCSNPNCCSSSGFCGTDPAYCGTNCVSGYGLCDGVSITDAFQWAIGNQTLDNENGAVYYYDKANSFFWTWDNALIVDRKFAEIVKPLGLGGIFAWSAAQDSEDWSHIRALQLGAKSLPEVC